MAASSAVATAARLRSVTSSTTRMKYLGVPEASRTSVTERLTDTLDWFLRSQSLSNMQVEPILARTLESKAISVPKSSGCVMSGKVFSINSSWE